MLYVLVEEEAIDSFSFLELEFLGKHFEKLFDLSSGIGLLIIIQWDIFRTLYHNAQLLRYEEYMYLCFTHIY